MKVRIRKVDGEWLVTLVEKGECPIHVGTYPTQDEGLQRGLFAGRFLHAASSALRRLAQRRPR